jgi:hypothetical protein
MAPKLTKRIISLQGKIYKGSTFEDQVQFINHELHHNEERAGDLLNPDTPWLNKNPLMAIQPR